MITTKINEESVSWILGSLILTIGISNLVLVHPVPGLTIVFLSLLFFPPVNNLGKKLGFSFPFGTKLILAFIIIWFTLGVSDLGDIIDDLYSNTSAHN